jgi:hypothetical protein
VVSGSFCGFYGVSGSLGWEKLFPCVLGISSGYLSVMAFTMACSLLGVHWRTTFVVFPNVQMFALIFV